MINHHSQFLRIATDSNIRNSSTFMFYRMKYYETFFMEKTRKRPLLSVATIGSLICQSNVYKIGLASLLVDTVLSTRWWCTQSKINLDIWVRVVYNITRYWGCDRSVLEDNGDERYTVKYPLIDIKTTFWKACSVVSDFLNLSVPSWYDERRPGVPSIIINGKTWEQLVNFNWDSNSSRLIYCPLIYSRAKLDQRDQKFDLLYPIRNR